MPLQHRGRLKPKPVDEGYILRLGTELMSRYESQDAQIDRLRQVRTLTRPVALDNRYQLVAVEVRDPAIADEIQRITAMLSVNRPKCVVTPVGGDNAGDKATENRSLREQWSEQVLWEAGARSPGHNAFRENTDMVVGDGAGWMCLTLAKDLWEERYGMRLSQFSDDGADVEKPKSAAVKFDKATEEAKKRAGPPFVLRAVDVRQLYPVWTQSGLSEVLEIQERPLYSTLREYHLRITKNGEIVPDDLGEGMSQWEATLSTQYQTVRFYAHWTPTTVTYLISSSATGGQATTRILEQFEHKYGRVPYFPAMGLMMGFMHNRKVGWSISESKRWLVEYRAYLRTILAQLAARDTLSPLKLTRDVAAVPALPYVGDDERPRDNEQWDLRMIIPLRPGEDLRPIEFAPVADSLKMEIEAVSKDIENLSSPRTPSVVGPGVEGAGFAINSLLSEGKIRHDPLSQSVERQYTDLTRFLWRLVRVNVKETVWVRSGGKEGGFLGAGPDDLTDDVGVDWELNYEQPSAELIKERAIHERLSAGTLNLDTAIERLGDSADEVRQGKLIDQMRQSPWYMQLMEQHVLQLIGRGDLLSQGQQASQLAQTGQMPQLPLGGNAPVAPDQSNLAMAPGGVGAAAQAMAAHAPGMGPPNGAVSGVGPGAVVPAQAAGAGLQQPINVGR